MTVHDAARRGFERQAEAYERVRPTYPEPAAAWLAAELGLRPARTVVDVGAGTGKLTRSLVPSGATVIAVEPVAAMRAVLERELPGVTAFDGAAESLPLDDGAADAIVAGQAFHWFDGPVALAEFHRVLQRAGRLGLIWNARDRRQPLQHAIDELIEPLRGSTPSLGSGSWRAAFEGSALFRPVSERKIPFELALEPDMFVDRIGSVSFVAALDDDRRTDLLERVRQLAAEHPEPWSYVAEVYVFERTTWGTVSAVSEEQPDTKELRLVQSRREAEERALAGAAADEQETATHQRRAEKAHYLRQKLEERAESERETSRPSGSTGEEAPEPQVDE